MTIDITIERIEAIALLLGSAIQCAALDHIEVFRKYCSPRGEPRGSSAEGRMPDALARRSRRSVIRIALMGAAVRLTMGPASIAAAQEKMSQRDAEYQGGPKDIRMCATCSLFLPPTSCKVVDGEISPNGWCKLFVIAD